MALRLRRTLTPISCPCWWRHLSSTAAPKPPPLLWEHSSKSSTSKESITLQLFSWGRGASGQLGGGIEEIRIYPAPVATLSVPLNFSLSHAIPGRLSQSLSSSEAQVEVGISCGLFHSGLVVDGKLWIWGKGDGGRLGFGHENSVFVPTLNPNLESKLRSIALGGLHSIALDVLGRVFTWGYGGFGALGHSVYHRELLPKLVEGSWDGEICRIATSGTHTAAITKSGKLYIWGRDEGDGRLGLGPGRGPDHAGGNSTPSEVKALPVPVAAASCGGFFTMALTEEGQLWNWGANSNYELGRGDKIGGWKPQPVPSLKDISENIYMYLTVLYVRQRRSFSWGHGGHGQLGHSSLHSRKIPEPVEALANERVSYIACGGSSSAAITDKGKLYMWGNAADSQLGVPGLRDVQSSPIEVNFLGGRRARGSQGDYCPTLLSSSSSVKNAVDDEKFCMSSGTLSLRLIIPVDV
ncbi:RCC1 domain-containing protein RUG3, mitochondrial [Sesamum angolense]|uniref:RCC1 domain-containing protein RUG3, mitochondrial n=1 Tax=Sesamum angolense TaxID=2727404 RepID=A0AAE1T9P5_9LAMI|nr:RCC1 domain-containing protein RUG3, mitochondrial [Sesamum angolense]